MPLGVKIQHLKITDQSEDSILLSYQKLMLNFFPDLKLLHTRIYSIFLCGNDIFLTLKGHLGSNQGQICQTKKTKKKSYFMIEEICFEYHGVSLYPYPKCYVNTRSFRGQIKVKY